MCLDKTNILIPLTGILAGECFEVGRQAYINTDFYHTIMWMQESYDRSLVEVNKTVSPVIVLDFLTYAMYKVGDCTRYKWTACTSQ